MNRLLLILFVLSSITSSGQTSQGNDDDARIRKIIADPSPQEIDDVLVGLRQLELTPKNVVIHDSVALSNTNLLYILSHMVAGKKHFGAVIIPKHKALAKLPVIIFATGGDGMHTEFNIAQDFIHPAVQFPAFMGEPLDNKFIVVIPSFRGQQLILGDQRYQSEGNVGDAFNGATTDALAFLNVILKTFKAADERRIGIYGGSRGGTVALLAASRDKRIKKAIVVAAPTDMKGLYLLYPDQFKVLFFNDLLAGKISEHDARNKFISSSPLYFVKELPPVQLHHDDNDPFVPVKFAQILVDSIIKNGNVIDPYFYNEGIHGFWKDEKYWKRVQEFAGQLSE